jgi:hypothetical protein
MVLAGPSSDEERVIMAVESLYSDQLKPYSRILLKRLREQAEQLGMDGSGRIADAGRLREVCESMGAWLLVQAENGAEWSALLRNRPVSFVDVYSPQDIYPSELWRAAQQYFEGLDDGHMTLPGGRYSCAQALQARELPFLAGRSLGELCHIVQLGISQKKLLGYLHGAVVPYGRSQSRLKDHCAEQQKPCEAEASTSEQLADWETMRTFLREIMSRLTPGVDSIPLSNLKRLFRTRFKTKGLSETALGHSKLSELLQDERLRDICKVVLNGHNYVVTPVLATPPRSQHVREEPEHTTSSRTRALHLSLDEALHPTWPPSACPPVGVPPAVEVLPPLSGCATIRHGRNDFRDVHRTPSPPSCSWGSRARCFPREADGLAKPLPVAERRETNNLVQQEACQEHESKLGRLVLTPCTLSSMGFQVSNTFIHAFMPPPTPLCNSSRRSRSLPRGIF